MFSGKLTVERDVVIDAEAREGTEDREQEKLSRLRLRDSGQLIDRECL